MPHPGGIIVQLWGSAAGRSTRSRVVLLAVHAGALVILGALDPPLFACANMAVSCRIGFLAIDMGLAPLQ